MHSKCLRESDVASVSERSNAKTLFNSQEFILVEKGNICNADLDIVLFLVSHETGILEPFKIVQTLDLARIHSILDHTGETDLMHVNRHKSFDFGSF
jgi:hypothetical protein